MWGTMVGYLDNGRFIPACGLDNCFPCLESKRATVPYCKQPSKDAYKVWAEGENYDPQPRGNTILIERR